MAFPDYVGLTAADCQQVVHVYSLCFFRPGDVVPSVELVEAFDDADAMQIARRKRPSLMREIWDRHRLVARLEPRS